MRGVPIKFRGVDVNGHYHYGDLVHGRTMGQTFIYVLEGNLFDEGANTRYKIPVIPDSVRQLVAYDTNGDEIYEGDMVGELVSYSHWKDCFSYIWQAVAHLGCAWCQPKVENEFQKLCEANTFYSKFYRVYEDNKIIIAGEKFSLVPVKKKDKNGNEHEFIEVVPPEGVERVSHRIDKEKRK